MSGDTFVEVITVISEWKTHSYNYRLVNLGAGPDRLQIKVNGKWVEESIPYRWAVVTARIKKLEEL